MNKKNYISMYRQLISTIHNAKVGVKFRKQIVNAIKLGFDIDYAPQPTKFSNGIRLLEGAIICRKDDIVRCLLNLGADADIITNSYGLPPLSLACQNNLASDVIKILAKKTKNINAKDNNGHTALGLLCKSYIRTHLTFSGRSSLDKEIGNIMTRIKILLEFGAKLDIDQSWKDKQQYIYLGQTYSYLYSSSAMDDILSLINDLESWICAYIETKSELQLSTEIGYEYEI